MKITVTAVEFDGTIGIGTGITEDGTTIRFGGDQRPMQDIQRALDRGEEPEADVPEWTVLSRVKPDAGFCSICNQPVQRGDGHHHADPWTIEAEAKRINIGDVAVTDTACENPYTYRGKWNIGDGRHAALLTFRDGGDTTGMQLWHAPANGGARRITTDEVDWTGVR